MRIKLQVRLSPCCVDGRGILTLNKDNAGFTPIAHWGNSESVGILMHGLQSGNIFDSIINCAETVFSSYEILGRRK